MNQQELKNRQQEIKKRIELLRNAYWEHDPASLEKNLKLGESVKELLDLFYVQEELKITGISLDVNDDIYPKCIVSIDCNDGNTYQAIKQLHSGITSEWINAKILLQEIEEEKIKPVNQDSGPFVYYSNCS